MKASEVETPKTRRNKEEPNEVNLSNGASVSSRPQVVGAERGTHLFYLRNYFGPKTSN